MNDQNVGTQALNNFKYVHCKFSDFYSHGHAHDFEALKMLHYGLQACSTINILIKQIIKISKLAEYFCSYLKVVAQSI